VSSDGRRYEQSKAELNGEFRTLARVFESPAKYYLAAAFGVLSESASYNPEADELTLTGDRKDISPFNTGRLSGFMSGVLAMLPAGLSAVLFPFIASYSTLTLVPFVGLLFGLGLSLGTIRTATGWTVIDESVERPETTEVVEQYVNGDLQDERELEEKLEASLK